MTCNPQMSVYRNGRVKAIDFDYHHISAVVNTASTYRQPPVMRPSRRWETSGSADCLYSIPHARTFTILLELDPWTSPCPVAQPLSALAHGNVFRPEDGQDRLCGILGIHGTGTKTASPIFEVDR
jgi:hypothetical protein